MCALIEYSDYKLPNDESSIEFNLHSPYYAYSRSSACLFEDNNFENFQHFMQAILVLKIKGQQHEAKANKLIDEKQTNWANR